MNTTDVQSTLREMWETRPARPRDDRQVAGVASAIARRYDIDPVLVRVGFVVAAISGIGVGLYIAGWILLPESPADPADPVPSRSRGLVVVGLVIAAMVTLGTFFDGGGGVVLPTLAVALLLFLLHRSRGDRGTARLAAASSAAMNAPTVATPAADAGPATTGPSLVKEQPGQAADALPVQPATPPSWDPLGAAPFAWDLPEPSGAPPEPPRRKLPVTPVTLGVALLAGGVTAVILLAAGALTVVNMPLLFGVALAVIGAGLVVGAFARAGRGLIPIALILCALTWGVLSAPLESWRSNGGSDLRAAPTAVTALLPAYERTAGDIDLDLRNLDLTVPAGGDASPVATRISLGVGDVQVLVPANADVTVNASAGIGDVSFGDERMSGPGARIDVVDDLGADGVRSGRPLVLDIEAGAGDLEVTRG